MGVWFETGRFVYPVLMVIGLEIGVLIVWHARTRRGLAPVDIVGNLASGALIFVALERAASRAHWGWIAGFSFASFVAHLFDLRRRWRASGGTATNSPQRPGNR